MNKLLYVVLFGLMIPNFIFCNGNKKMDKNDYERVSDIKNVKEWKHGFALDAKGNPLCFISAKIDLADQLCDFTKSENEINKVKEQLITDYYVQIFDDEIRVEGALKEKPGLVKGSRRIYYKIENNAGYVSADGKNWEELEIKYYKETGKKDRFGDPLILVYFECSFFKGEYQLGFRM